MTISNQYRVTYQRDDGEQSSVVVESENVSEATILFEQETGYSQDTIIRIQKQ